MEYTFSIKELLAIVKQGWKIILTITLIITILTSGFYLYKGYYGNDVSATELQQNSSDIEAYEQWSAAKDEVVKSIQVQLMRAYERIEKSPLMQINAYDCRYHRICIALDEPNDASRCGLIYAWMVEEYGDPQTPGAKYQYVVDGDTGETDVFILDTNKYSLDAAAEEVKEFLVRTAKEQGVPVLTVGEMTTQGYLGVLFELQDSLRNNAIKLQTELTNYSNNTFNAPTRISQPNISKRGLIKYAMLGIICGLFLGLLFIVSRVVRKGTLLSTEQIKRMVSLTELGTYHINDADNVNLLSVTIDAAGESKRIMLFNDAAPEACLTLASALNKKAKQEFSCGSGLTEDITSADVLSEADGVVIPLLCGKSSIKDLQKSVQWAQRFHKKVLGYVVLTK